MSILPIHQHGFSFTPSGIQIWDLWLLQRNLRATCKVQAPSWTVSAKLSCQSNQLFVFFFESWLPWGKNIGRSFKGLGLHLAVTLALQSTNWRKNLRTGHSGVLSCCKAWSETNKQTQNSLTNLHTTKWLKKAMSGCQAPKKTALAMGKSVQTCWVRPSRRVKKVKWTVRKIPSCFCRLTVPGTWFQCQLTQ